MDAPTAAGEILRRVTHLVNRPYVNENDKYQSYSTPYNGFFHTHMPEYNQMIISSLAMPHGTSLATMQKEKKSDAERRELEREVPQIRTAPSWDKTKMTLSPLQWPYRFQEARLVDDNNQLWCFDMSELLQENLILKDPHVEFQSIGKKFYPKTSLCSATVAKELEKQFGTGHVDDDHVIDFNSLAIKWNCVLNDSTFMVSMQFLLGTIKVESFNGTSFNCRVLGSTKSDHL